jgi:hypothetical protein
MLKIRYFPCLIHIFLVLNDCWVFERFKCSVNVNDGFEFGFEGNVFGWGLLFLAIGKGLIADGVKACSIFHGETLSSHGIADISSHCT